MKDMVLRGVLIAGKCLRWVRIPVPKPDLLLALPEPGSEVGQGSKVFYFKWNGEETLEVTSFSVWGIVLALFAAGWLFISLFAFTIHTGLAAVFCVLEFFLIMGPIFALYSHISVSYCPERR